MKFGIFTGGTRLRSKNIFTAISRYPTGKHEIMFQAYQRQKSSFSLKLFCRLQVLSIWICLKYFVGKRVRQHIEVID